MLAAWNVLIAWPEGAVYVLTKDLKGEVAWTLEFRDVNSISTGLVGVSIIDRWDYWSKQPRAVVIRSASWEVN